MSPTCEPVHILLKIAVCCLMSLIIFFSLAFSKCSKTSPVGGKTREEADLAYENDMARYWGVLLLMTTICKRGTRPRLSCRTFPLVVGYRVG